MALVVPMTTDVIHSFISRMSFIYLLKLLYFSLLYFLLYRILISKYGNIHQKAFSFFLFFFYFSLLFLLSKESEASQPASHHVSLYVTSINTPETNTRFLSLQLLRQTSKMSRKMLYEILFIARSDKYRSGQNGNIKTIYKLYWVK